MKAILRHSIAVILLILIMIIVLAGSCGKKSTKQDQDKTPPEVTLTYPLNGWVIMGTVTVTADANDASGVEKVEFYLDGQLRCTDTSAAWEYVLDCTTLADSTQHTLYAKAYDPYGNAGKSSINSVLVRHAVEPPRPTGLVFMSDETYYGIPIAPPSYSGTLPSSVDLTNHMPAVGNQGAQSSCVGWAVGYALKTYQESVERGWSLSDKSHVFSPSYIYNQIQQGECGGSLLSDAFNVLTSQGCASISTMPYSESDCKAMPSAGAKQEAANYKIEYWRRVNFVDPTEVKKHLAGGFPVVLGILVYENFFYLGPNDVYDKKVGQKLGGHAVCITGYDDTKSAFKIINSWGTNWGGNGYGWIAYGFLPTVCLEAFVAKDLGQVPTDTTKPGVVTNLTAIGSTDSSVTLAWTAPGDDGNSGTASLYDIRYSTSNITTSNWNSATQCNDEPSPKVAGSSESFTVTALSSHTKYYFALKTADEVPNWSGLSNVDTARTSPPPDTIPPASVTDLATSNPTSSSIKLTWTAPGDDGNSGTASLYDIRYSTSNITTSNWNSATQCNDEPSPKVAGSSESFTVTALSSHTKYYFALKTADEVPNWSGISNVDTGKTTPTLTLLGSYAAKMIVLLRVVGDYAYFVFTTPAYYSWGIEAVNISNPAVPTFASRHEWLTSEVDAGCVYVSGNYAFVTDVLDTGRVLVFDITNLSDPDLIGSCYTRWRHPQDIYISGSYAYVLASDLQPEDDGAQWGLEVIDISKPYKPSRVGSWILGTCKFAWPTVYVSQGLAYILEQQGRIHIVDVSQPSNPVFVASYDMFDLPISIYVSGHNGYFVGYNYGSPFNCFLKIFDISDPSNLILTGTCYLSGCSLPGRGGVAVLDNYVFVAAGDSGLQVIDVSNPSDPKPALSYNTPDSGTEVLISGNYVFLSDWSALLIFEFTP